MYMNIKYLNNSIIILPTINYNYIILGAHCTLYFKISFIYHKVFYTENMLLQIL